jgi:iron complex outermembrane receptor protein
MIRCAFLVAFGVLTADLECLAQDEAKPDTVRLVRIGDSLHVFSDTTTFFHPGAVVVGSRAARHRSANTIQTIGLIAVERSDATSVAELARLIPSAHVQTNSRGESLLYMRNAGERQLAVYFDGALLNIPWDNRVDLDMIPASALASISISKGSVSSEFGPNLMGGAVNLISRDLAGAGRYAEVGLHVGSGSERQFEAMHMGRSSSVSYLAAVGYFARDGQTLPDDPGLTFSQTDPHLRTNTDLRRLNVLARAEYTFPSDLAVSIAALAIDAEKGIAPEGHKDPAQGGVRYWRYPDWTNRMVIATLGRPAHEGRPVSYQTSVWFNHFDQSIVAYASDAFETPTEREDDDDATIGGRVILAGDFDRAGVHLSAGALHTRHDQIDSEYSFDPILRTDAGPRQRYRQLLLNAGFEGDYRIGRATYSAGINLDSRSIPEAYTFSEPGAQTEFGGRAGLIYDVSGPLEFRASTGRRSRFPTLREQFSGALGRFVLNPDLGSEVAWLSESSLRYEHGELVLEATGFLTLTSNTIDQTVVVVEGSSKRKRVNLDGSRNIGVEFDGAYRPVPQVRTSVTAMISHLRAEDSDTGAYDRPLTERPENTGTFRVEYIHPAGASAAVEVEYTGRAFSLDDDGEFVDLAASTVFNLRCGYRVMFTRRPQISAALFLRVNNIGDTLVENQLGLPGPGRTALAGFKLSI